MKLKRPLPDGRTFEQIRNHYEVEKLIARKLKESNKEQRKSIYKTMYDELFEKVPDHQRLKRRKSKELTWAANKSKLGLVGRFLNKSSVFVEFAPGDCKFSMEVCKYARSVYGIDISDQTGQTTDIPHNFKLVIYDGYHLGIDENSVDIVFSDQFIEHLHPEDTVNHFRLVKKILKDDGVYVFRTPHNYSGPHDISCYFSDEPEGFHLKEYTYTEIAKIVKSISYSSWNGYWNAKGMCVKIPFVYFYLVEKMLKILPCKYRRHISKLFLPKIVFAATK